jgi:hypothetical protein
MVMLTLSDNDELNAVAAKIKAELETVQNGINAALRRMLKPDLVQFRMSIDPDQYECFEIIFHLFGHDGVWYDTYSADDFTDELMRSQIDTLVYRVMAALIMGRGQKL